MNRPKKIFIVGSPGSGKTTLAAKLSKKLNIPHFDLDEIRFPSPNIRRSDKEAIPLVAKLTQKPAWIIEGVYILWIQEFIKKSDLVIWLNTPFYISFYRIVIRYLGNLLEGKAKHSFKSTLLLLKNLTLFHFAPNIGEYVTKEQTSNALSTHKDKVVIVDKNSQLESFMKKF